MQGSSRRESRVIGMSLDGFGYDEVHDGVERRGRRQPSKMRPPVGPVRRQDDKDFQVT